MTNAGSLYVAATDLLAAAVAILGGTPAGAPSNQYVSHGPPAYDCCDTVTVHAGVIAYGDFSRGAAGTARTDAKMHVVPVVPLTITALRCARAVPQGGIHITLPAPALTTADAAMVYTDGWSLFNGVHKMQRDGTLFPTWPCRVFEVDAAIPISPEGGCLGWSIDVHVQIDGFDPPGA